MSSTEDSGSSSGSSSYRLSNEPVRPLARARDRFDTPAPARLVLLTGLTSVTTFLLGALQGGKLSGYQFLAENAHRLPRTHQGWYFYHKTKNYRVMYGGLRHGFRYAGRTAGWTLLFGALEAGIDAVRGPEYVDFLSPAAAAATTGALFARRNRFSRQLTKRTVGLALGVGAVAGLLQDFLTAAQGKGKVWYIDGDALRRRAAAA